MQPVATPEFSFLHLFMMADWVVKSVMIGLAVASVWSWAVAVEKWLQLRRLENGVRVIESALAEGRGVEGLEDAPRGDATARIVGVGMAELRAARRAGQLGEGGIERALERMERMMGAALTRESARAERGIGVLATIGSAAPFIGLFGTVWGIMNAFRGIAASNNTNLAVVAPGIAEALFATALGLLAAIPATIFYNVITGGLDRYVTRVETICDELVARASRRLGDGQGG